jgi:hypothetical protein
LGIRIGKVAKTVELLSSMRKKSKREPGMSKAPDLSGVECLRADLEALHPVLSGPIEWETMEQQGSNFWRRDESEIAASHYGRLIAERLSVNLETGGATDIVREVFAEIETLLSNSDAARNSILISCVYGNLLDIEHELRQYRHLLPKEAGKAFDEFFKDP